MVQSVITSVLSLSAGVGVFLIACSMLSENLEALGSKRLKGLFAKTSKSKLVGVGVGAIATAAVQSSSAITVMVIGFVNAGIMSLTQAATIIFGANIGTTITGQIVALGLSGGSGISISTILAALSGAGALVWLLARRDSVKKIGGITAGVGMIFVGLSLMSSSMKGFAQLDEVRDFIALFENPLLLVLIGALFTALIQSSSAVTSMVITMAVSGLISLNQGVYITMGSNVGTCITALIAGATAGTNAKRASLVHLIFNVGGSLLFLIIGGIMHLFGWEYGSLLGLAFPSSPQLQLAMFHTLFNVVTVIAVLPFTNLLVKGVSKILPQKAQEKAIAPRLYFVDEHMLKTPPVAVGQVKNEIINMAGIAQKNFMSACKMVCSLDLSEGESFFKNEEQLNFINDNLSAFIVKLLKSPLSERDRQYLSSAFHAINHLERVGDYARNIVEYAQKLKGEGKSFSPAAVGEIERVAQVIQSLYTQVLKVYVDGDGRAYAQACALEDEVDALTKSMGKQHINRLNQGICPPEVGAKYLALACDTERVADHYINLARTAKGK